MSGAAYFHSLYANSDDPWSVGQRWYEARKRAVVLAALPQSRYRNAFEPACGNGELSLALATRCDALLASDATPRAVALAKEKLLHSRHVTVEHQILPQDWPSGKFDLILISELAYFLDAADLQQIVAHSVASLTPDGTLLACDWRADFGERVLSTQTVHAAFNAAPQLTRLLCHEEEDFLLEVWSPDKRSVARREGFA